MEPTETVEQVAVDPSALEVACDIAGGVTALARRLGVGQPTVSNWIARGRVPVEPVNQVLAIEAATGVSRHKLRPDIYPPAESPVASA